MNRYTNYYESMEVCEDGEWVTSSDHDAEVERLRGLLRGLHVLLDQYSSEDFGLEQRMIDTQHELEL
jgi:Holliday junction resolvasome RuvABC endonuclease subunit